ncbi:MAG: ribosomal protein small subunit ribosomal protein [Candidatus Parcubacteria bacterium]|jgi:small subunit ribosomal protein S10
MTTEGSKKPTKAASKAAAKKSKNEGDKLRITVRAYDHKLLDLSVKQIVQTAERFGVSVRGPIPLPTDIRKYTVNRASFIDKDAREQFEIRTHKRLIDIVSPNQKVIEALTNIDLPSGVSIQVKTV